MQRLLATAAALALVGGACREARAGGLGAPIQVNAPPGAYAAIGDFDGDGYSDVAFGDDFGLATWEVHAGSANGVAIDPTYLLPPFLREQGGNLPWSAGDLNADGYDDLLVTAWQSPASVLLGSASGLRDSNAIELVRPSSGVSGWRLATEDLDGDGYPEIVADHYIYRGTERGPSPTPPTDWKLPGGAASYVRIVGVGDLNGDGFGDLGVLKAGLHICQGGCDLSAIACVEVNGAPPLESLLDVAGAGDIDGDGFADLVVTADLQAFNDLRQTLSVLHGAAAVFDAPSLGATYTSSLAVSVRFGEGVAGVGDVDCDGFDDVAVGGTRSGAAELTLSLFRGSPTGLLDPPAIIGGAYGGPESLYGSPRGGGDFNGDGYRDVFVTGDSFLLGFGDPGVTCAPRSAPVRESPPECPAPADGCSCATVGAPHGSYTPTPIVALALWARARRRRSRA